MYPFGGSKPLPPSSPPSSAMATPPPQPFKLNLWTILTESERIIKAHSRHFLALSFLFLLPLSISFSAYPYLHQLINPQPSTVPTAVETHNFNPAFQPTKTTIFSLLYSLFVSIFTSLATSSITYSVFHGFYGQPIKLKPAIKSAFSSFFRLLSTSFLTGLILFGFFFVVGLIIVSLVMATLLLGFQVDYSSPNFIFLFIYSMTALICILIYYIQVNWIFAPTVVVVESSWGFEALKRSKYLVRGMKWVAFGIFLYFGFCVGILWWSTAYMWKHTAPVFDYGGKWIFLTHLVFTSLIFVRIQVSYLAAITVLYIHSKEMHGEINAGEILEEFGTEYVKVPLDDGKLDHDHDHVLEFV
ncbi:hypothetical protein COLO4_27962 [Corchorus olitorius]|uniref:Transmembrane protein n=1 Tax=Corchorus olitorius TaxID=93759 RepID=A0A1R3HNH9_9ROSI|nr:hypothetical protein COLO4_27962 [Corchorus olitorius]